MRALACVLTAVLVLVAAVLPAPAGDLELAVIVHPSRATSLTREAVKRIYLKRQRFWEDGQEIVVINQEVATAARQTFTRLVFGDFAAACTMAAVIFELPLGFLEMSPSHSRFQCI